MENTKIIWTEKTWNPVSGCEKVSRGCKYCYAETIANAYRGKAYPNGFGLTYRSHKLMDPHKWKPSLIFVNSMSDYFWEEISDDYRLKILRVIRDTPEHEYQVLTKRPEKMVEFSKQHLLPPNFWAGVTVENKKALNRIDLLREAQAEIKFISFEPLFESLGDLDLRGIDWAITGGESGVHLFNPIIRAKRGLVIKEGSKWLPDPAKIDFVREIRDACAKSGTSFFHKQWGGRGPESAGRVLDGKFYSAIPRLPGDRETIQNDFLKLIETPEAHGKQANSPNVVG